MKYLRIGIITAAFLCTASSPYAEGTWKVYLESSRIHDMAAEGQYIWCATQGGVVRWNSADGTYEKYTTLDGLGWNYVRSVAVDSSGTKWFGGDNGSISSFDGAAWKTHTEERTYVPTLSIAVDRDNNLWFAGGGYTVKFFDRVSWKSYDLKGVSFRGSINAVAVDTENRKWFGTYDDGAVCFDGSTWTAYTTEDGLADNKVVSIAVDNNGVMWFGTWEGVSSFDGETWTTYPVENYTHGNYTRNGAYKIVVDGDNVKWFATHYGAASFDGSAWTTYTTENSGLRCNEIFNIAIDSSGGKWFSYSPYSGIYVYDQRVVTKFDGTNWSDFRTEGPLDNGILRIGIDDDNVKWFGTFSGTSLFDDTAWSTVIPPNYPSNWYFYDFAVDDERIIWLGTGAGAASYDGKDWTNYTTDNSGLLSNRVNAVAVDRNGIKWFGTPEGVSRFDGTAWKTYTEEDGLVDNYVYVMAVDNDNVKWIGTVDGISSFDGNSWTAYDADGSLPDNIIRDIAVDHDNIKWVGTFLGVVSFDGMEWTTYTAENSGLIYNSVGSVAVDHNNVKWFGSGVHASLVSFNGTTWKQYTTQDGLACDQIQDIAVDKNNVKWFCSTIGGISSFKDDPANGSTGVLKIDDSPSLCKILGNYPNPFNISTIIEFSLPSESYATLTVFSVTGQKIKELVSATLSPGIHTARWDGRDENVVQVSSGIYFVRLKAGTMSSISKIILMK